MANYPNAIPSFSNKSPGQTIAAAHINSAQDEIVAIGSGLLQGTAQLNSSNSTVANLSVLGGSTVALSLGVGVNLSVLGAASIGGNSTIAGSLTVSGGVAIGANASALGSLSVGVNCTVVGALVVGGNVTVATGQVTALTLAGQINANNANLQVVNVVTSTGAAAGGVASLPATVGGYIKTTLNGSTVMIPYYPSS